MYIIIWEYQVKPDKQSEFERTYASNGVWAELFKNAEGYLGTELIQSDKTPETYTTIDRWESKESYENFLLQWQAEYNKLDELCEGLTEHEKRIGDFRQILT